MRSLEVCELPCQALCGAETTLVLTSCSRLWYCRTSSLGDNTCDEDDISIASTSSDGALFGSNGAATQAASPLWAKLENERHCAPQDASEVHEKPECLETYCGRTPCRYAGRSSHGVHPPLQQLQEQLECFDRLMESPGTRRETADVIMTRSKEVISSMRERASEEDLLDVC